MTRIAVGIVVTVVASLATWLLVEGVWSVAHGRKPVPSLAARAAELAAGLGAGDEAADEGDGPPLLRSRAALDALLPELEHAHVVLGNSPYRKLASEAARFTTGDAKAGTLRLKPDLDAETAFLRTTLFAPLDPLNYTVRRDEALPAGLGGFFARYAFAPRTLTTNAFGERTTRPPSDADTAVLVAGDSVAFGQMLGDDEHLASQLQTRVPGHRFVNLGIPGGSQLETLAALEEAAARTPRIAALVYVHFDNDFVLGQTPESVVDRLAAFAKAHGLPRVVFVAHHYLYLSMPEIFRTDAASFEAERARARELLARATAAGFTVIDTRPLIEAAQDEAGSLLAGAALYLDHAHLSREGTRRLAALVAPALEGAAPGTAAR